jgi:CheY-like chemotaxis protein
LSAEPVRGTNGEITTIVTSSHDVLNDVSLKEARIVAMSPFSDKDSTECMEKTGAACLLTKPVRLIELVNTMEFIQNGNIGNHIEKKDIEKNAHTGEYSTARILVAEDNLINQMVITGMLEKSGISADIVLNGKEVLKKLEKTRYDLVFMDLQMPEMDGFEATLQIRRETSHVLDKNVIIIALTAHVMKSDIDRCFNAGMNDYLSMPVNAGELGLMLDKWLKNKGETAHPKSPLNLNDDSTEIFDFKGVSDRLMNDTELLNNVITLFFSDTSKKMQTLKRAISEQNSAQVELIAHSMKGAAGNVGLERFRKIAGIIELGGRAGDLSIGSGMIKELDEQLKVAKEYVSKVIPDIQI